VSDAVVELKKRSDQEGFRRNMGIEVLEIEPGRCLTALEFGPQHGNVFGMMHGAAVFGLMDEAFQLACNAFGEISVAMQMSLNFLSAPDLGARLMAEAKQVHATNKTDLYHLRVWQEADGKPIATCQALAYRTRKPHPWAGEE
jgi:acyl-CoA thioesterase